MPVFLIVLFFLILFAHLFDRPLLLECNAYVCTFIVIPIDDFDLVARYYDI